MPQEHDRPVIPHAWGFSRLLWESPSASAYSFTGMENGQSSMHYHKTKANVFICATGQIRIVYRTGEAEATDFTVIGEHESVTVPAGVAHRMEFVEDSTGFEFYYDETGRVDPSDIVRLDVGWTPDGRRFENA